MGLTPGCAERWAADSDTLPYPVDHDRHPSLVCDAPLLEAASRHATGEPWYAGRNDQRPTVIDGYQHTILEGVTTYTYDRQSSSSGRVTDQYHQQTYRFRTSTTTR